jgi:hypothetical protein
MRIRGNLTGLLCALLVATSCGNVSTKTASTAPPNGPGGTVKPAIVYSAATISPTTAVSEPTTTSVVEPTVLTETVEPSPTTAPVPPAPLTAPPTAPPALAPAAPDPCSVYDFRNFTFYLPDYGTITVADGLGVRGTPGTLGYISLRIRDVVIGDIGGVDGKAETAIFTLAETGTEGRFSDVHIFTCSRSAVTLLASAGSGDRAYGGVRSIAMRDKKLLVDRYADDNGACCPAAISHQTFTLSRTALEPVGIPTIVKYSTMNTGPTAISFLSNTSTAALGGDTTMAKPAGLVAYKGQRLKVAVLPAVVGENPVTLDIVLNAARIESVTSGRSTIVTLPADGYYEVHPRASAPGADGTFDAEVTIGRAGETALAG